MKANDRAGLISEMSVYMDDQLVGILHRTDPLSFTYDPAWLPRSDARALHPTLPLSAERINSPQLHAFFENLLPEGDQRRIIELRNHVSSVFGLLTAVGGDTAGSIVLLPQGQAPQQPIYQNLTWEQVNALLHSDGKLSREREEIESAISGMPKPRLSISGAQFKMLLSLDENGQPLRPLGNSPSSHILKPDIVRTDIKVFASSVNETIVMRAARLCQLPTANVSYQPLVNACLVERYDRLRRPDGTLARLWQADFCQIAGKPSDVKYEADGGPSFKDCFEILGASSQPGVDRRNLLRWLFFNLYIGNNDSHAKNLSLLATKEGLRLAPFYDLMSTRVYTGLAPNFALSIGDNFEPGEMAPEHLEKLARSLGISPKYVMQIARDTADQVAAAIPEAAKQVMPSLGPPEQVMAERIQNKIGSLVKKMRNRMIG
ncbi:MAG TPA: type II toxin-antitoxin system HipA family toxin [Noviherbaspirillum sp.]|nr:type II toxin-antitoxin system HipA family toxin [Noviherbaspirillum sp.]